MSSKRSITAEARGRTTRAIAAAIIGPALVTLLALFEERPPTGVAGLLYVLVVVAAAGAGGAQAGVGAAVLSFFALNFFFTPPLHSFAVGQSQDLVALVVFLLVSVITGLLFSAAVREKAQAELRQAQTALLNDFTNSLMTGRSLKEALFKVSDRLVQMLDLAACEVETSFTQGVRSERDGARGTPEETSLVAEGETIGFIRVVPRAGRRPLDSGEREVIRAVAGQLSLALKSIRLSDEVRQAQVEAERSRLRAALFSGVTHDLKTPLAAITASVTSLLEGSTLGEVDQYEHLDTIRQEADHLNRLLSNLMDLARLRAGALTPARVPASIDEVVEAVLSRLRPLLKSRDVHLNLRGDLPEMAIDVVQIDQVLTNLVENAVKFSPDGSPIHVSAVGNDGLVRVTVADRGIGIPSEDRQRVFQPFERGEQAAAGTGLGLAIANAVVTAHGGRMWAQDVPTGGAAVTFELPAGQNGSRD